MAELSQDHSIRTWDMWNALEEDDRKLVHKSDRDIYRIYRQHENLEIWSVNEGLVTAFVDLEYAEKKVKAYTEAQLNANPQNYDKK